MPRRGSRIITSSGRIARSPDGSGVPSRSQSRIRVPIAARAPARRARRAPGDRAGARPRRPGSARPRRAARARPRPARCAVRSRGATAPSPLTTPSRAAALAKVASTARSTVGAERNERRSGTSSHGRPAARARVAKRACMRWKVSRSAPCTLMIDCFSSPTTNRLRERGRAPSPGKEVGGQRLDDRPLLGARVLALVDQQMIDLLVELEVDPGDEARPAEQRQRAGDQVVVVEPGLPALAPPRSPRSPRRRSAAARRCAARSPRP